MPVARDRERDPRAIGDLLPVLIAGRGWRDRMAVGRLRDAWAEIVGSQIAAHSAPVRLFRGTLTVMVEPGAWASELTLLAASLATKADAFLGGSAAVRQVTVTTGSFRPSEGAG